MSEDAEIYVTVSAADDTAVPCEKATRPAATGGGENSIERALGISPARDRRRKLYNDGPAYVATDRRQATELRQLILIGSLLAAYCRSPVADGFAASLCESGDAHALAIAWDDLLPAVRGTLIAAESR